MANLLFWMGFGAFFGWCYGWLRLAASHERAMEIIRDTPVVSRKERKKAIAYQRGVRFIAALVPSIGGALIGATIWSLGSLLTSLLN
ncbi:hypothetical protein [Roseibium aggregatum]|uniref:Uncharacterized protein n=1 Tax=Roseibium aggregatum TaxID=187304 RepID=A0A926S8B5_9HYPH|nr:hypothetical protein [Roseibium aggregatum]MBD1549681.1 hypothetical protein [Roseibium aggregatum]